jgi:UPF0716 protein FxsA
MPFFILFILIPFVEIYVFLQVGDTIGIGTTLFLAFFTAILGGIIIKYQGMATLQAVQNSMRHGQAPMAEIFDGFCLVAAGATLITPGFVTDTIGFLLLIPAVRKFLRQTIGKHIEMRSMNDINPGNPYAEQDAQIIEAEYTRVDDEDEGERKP